MSIVNLERQKFPFTICVALTIFILGITGCSNDSQNAPNATVDGNETTSTAAAIDPNSQQLEFFTERYLAADQRLKRRQDRIEAVLSAP